MIWETSISADNASQALEALVNAWSDDRNRVFVLRAKRLGSDPRSFYDANFSHIGRPVPLAEDVTAGDRNHQRTGRIWMEVRYDPKHPDAYRHSANAQPLHTDGSYIPAFPNATLMACVANAGEGGETTFIDGEQVLNCLQREAPELLAAIKNRTIPHARSGDRRVEKIIDRINGKILVNWNYYCVDPAVDPEGREIADRFFQYLAASPLVKENTKAVKLAPGDAVTWKDREVLHGRNGFVASQESERFLWKCAINVGDFRNER